MISNISVTMNTYECLYCKKELIKARNTKKYCSDKCRKYYHRHISGTISGTKKDVSVTKDVTVREIANKNAPISVTPENVSVTEEVIYEPEY